MSNRRTDILQIKMETSGDGQVKYSLAGVEKGLDGVGEKSERAAKGLTVARVGMLALAAVSISTAKDIATSIIQTSAEYEKLNASLKTVTGSQEEATRAMEMIKAMASDTPFSVQELTNSFIKLKALGLEPSKESLISYGNTASALGKDLNQMIEAVADATTGEFERLKEFGIKARQNGDEVALTFQGTTTTIKNSSEAIQQYLLDIGNNQFAGAMTEQMDTLNGAFSNLGDSTDRLMVAIGESGLGNAVKTTTQGLSNMASVVAQNIEQMGFLEGSIVGVMQAAYGMEAASPLSQTEKEIIALDVAIKENRQTVEQWQAQLDALRESGAAPEVLAVYQQGLERSQALLDNLLTSQEGLRNKGTADKKPADDGPSLEEKKKREKAAQKEHNDLMAEGVRLYSETRTEMEQLAIKEAQYQKLLDEGAISFDTYSRAVFEAREGLNQLSEEGDKTFDRLEAAVRGWGDSFTDTLADMVMTGKANFSDLANSIIRDLVRIAIQKMITDQIVGAATSYFGGMSAGVSHSGGIAGQSTSSRSVPALAFVGAPRYHTGGIAGDEVPAILRRGEEVLTENDPRHRNNFGGSGSLKLVIKNESSQPVEALDGGQSFDGDELVQSVILRDLDRGGQISDGIGRTFNLQRSV